MGKSILSFFISFYLKFFKFYWFYEFIICFVHCLEHFILWPFQNHKVSRGVLNWMMVFNLILYKITLVSFELCCYNNCFKINVGLKLWMYSYSTKKKLRCGFVQSLFLYWTTLSLIILDFLILYRNSLYLLRLLICFQGFTENIKTSVCFQLVALSK